MIWKTRLMEPTYFPLTAMYRLAQRDVKCSCLPSQFWNWATPRPALAAWGHEIWNAASRKCGSWRSSHNTPIDHWPFPPFLHPCAVLAIQLSLSATASVRKPCLVRMHYWDFEISKSEWSEWILWLAQTHALAQFSAAKMFVLVCRS